MLLSAWDYAIIIGGLIIFTLSIYAAKLLRQLKRQNTLQQQVVHEQKIAWQAHDNSIFASVAIIVRAMKEEQCDYAEGCWRLCVLLDSLKTEHGFEQQFPAIFELYAAIKHMPIMEQRKQLTKQQRMKLDLERMKAEARLTDDIQRDLEQLHQYVMNKEIS